MLRKAFLQLRNVEIDWDLQLHIVHVRILTQESLKYHYAAYHCCWFLEEGLGEA